MGLIQLATPLLSDKELIKFKQAVGSYNMNKARIIIDVAKDGLCNKSEDFLLLDNIENEIISEIEEIYDEEGW